MRIIGLAFGRGRVCRVLQHAAASSIFAFIVASGVRAEVPEGGARAAARGPSESTRQDFVVGKIDPDHDDDYRYRLPYGDDVSYPVLQAYGSKFSHRGAEHYTIDFKMHVGAPVHAARDGVAVLIEDSHEGGCWTEGCGRLANFVVLLHADGTTGEYFHLQRDSVASTFRRVSRGGARAGAIDRRFVRDSRGLDRGTARRRPIFERRVNS